MNRKVSIIQFPFAYHELGTFCGPKLLAKCLEVLINFRGPKAEEIYQNRKIVILPLRDKNGVKTSSLSLFETQPIEEWPSLRACANFPYPLTIN